MSKNKCIRVYANKAQIKNCKEQIKSVETAVKLLSNAFNLAGNEVRLNILYLISKEQKLCVCDISDILEMKIPAISQHLRKMNDAGIIDKERVAQTIFYYIKPQYLDLFTPFFEKIRENKILLDEELLV